MIVQLNFILAGGHIVDERFSTEPEFRLTYVRFSLDIKTHLPFRNYPTSSEVPKNPNLLDFKFRPLESCTDFTCFLILLLD